MRRTGLYESRDRAKTFQRAGPAFHLPPACQNAARDTPVCILQETHTIHQREGRTVAAKAPKYKVLRGLNYPPDNKRAEAGDVVDDLPDYAIDPLLRQGAIEPADDKKPEPGK